MIVLTLILTGTGQASAGVPQVVPEIDGASLATGLGALSAGVLVLRSYLGRG